jgi:peptidoglycan/xylan/chitin deacetylase (PgdA/CDA1 family)
MTDALVLCYHAVSGEWRSELSVTPAQLEAQLAFLLDRGYHAVTFHEALTASPAAKTLAVTFDDGFRSTSVNGLRVLSRLGIPGTVFVVTEFVGKRGPMSWPGVDQWIGGRYESELVSASWSELGELAGAGWEIGSHTCTHPHLTRCDDGALERELVASRARCEDELGRSCLSLAYPFGDYDARVERAAGRAGYATACTLPDRLQQGGPLARPRIGVWHDDDWFRFRMKVSRPVRMLRSSPLWTAAANGRRAAHRLRPRANTSSAEAG